MLTVLVHANYKTLLGKGRDHILNRRLHFLNHHKTGHQGFPADPLSKYKFYEFDCGQPLM